MSNYNPGAVALKQSLVLSFGLSYRQVASITGVHHRTVWQHVAANPGSNVTAWDSRPKPRQIVTNIEAWFAVVQRLWFIQTADTRGWDKNATEARQKEHKQLLAVATRYAPHIRKAVGDESMDARLRDICEPFTDTDVASAHEIAEFILTVRGI